MPSPEFLVLVTGTGTEVGKTWVAASLARQLRDRAFAVAARKPAQSFEPGSGATDADLLAEATREDPTRVCLAHRWYEVAKAPPMAAAELGRPSFTIDDLVSEISWPSSVDVGLVEGAGGPRSPLACDGDTVDLASALHPDLLVLVADAGLGTINATVLAAAPLAEALPDVPLLVVLNRFDPADDLHAANLAWLAGRGGFDVVSDESLADRVAGRCSSPPRSV